MDNTQIAMSHLAKKHRIETAVLDLSFDEQSMADGFQQQAHTYVLHTLLPAIDRVFEQHQQGWEICIDRLEIDLGELDGRDYLSQLETKLVAALSEKMMELNSSSSGLAVVTSSEQPDGIIKEISFRKLSSEESDWQQLCYFLNRGQLPWSSPFATGKLTSQGWQDWLVVTLFKNIKPLTTLLNRSPYLDSLLSRLVLQLSIEKSIELILKLAQPSRIKQVRYLFKLMFNYGDDAASSALEKRLYANGALLNSATNNEKLFFIRALFKALLTGSTRQSADAVEPINEWFPALVDIGQRYLSDELKPEFSAQFNDTNYQKQQDKSSRTLLVSALLIKAILSGDIDQLQSVWHLAVGEYRTEFLKLVIHLGQQAEVRYRLSKALSESMWQQLLELIEPTESDFIRRISLLFKPVKERAVDMSSASVKTLSDSQSKQQFWLFTLTYLLVERGSQFNRKSYLQSMLRQNASHHNISQMQLHQLLLQTLESLPMESALKRNMHVLLSQLQGELADHNLDEKLKVASHEVKLTAEQIALEDIATALNLGRYDRLKLHWSHYVSAYPDALITSLYLYGHQPICVTAIVTHFTLAMLRDTLGLLAPKERQFIQPLIEQTPLQLKKVEMAKPIEQRELTKQLWEFTFSYLLVERGSNFNNLSYLGYITHKIAAHNNLDHQEFVHHLASAFYSLEAPSEMQKQLLLLLAELLLEPVINLKQTESSSSSVELAQAPVNITDKTRQQYRQFILALTAGDATRIEQVIKDLDNSDRAFVIRVLHYFLKPANRYTSPQGLMTRAQDAIDRYLLALPRSTLTALLQLLYPTSQQWLGSLVNSHSILCVGLPSLNTFKAFDGNGGIPSLQPLISSMSLRRVMTFSKQLQRHIWREIWQSIGHSIKEEAASGTEISELSEQLIMRVFSRVAEFRNCTLTALLQAIELEHQINGVGGYLSELVTRQLKLILKDNDSRAGIQQRYKQVSSNIEIDSYLDVDALSAESQLQQLEHYQRISAGLTLVSQHIFFAVNHAKQMPEHELKVKLQQVIYWLAELFQQEPVAALSWLKRVMFGSFQWQHIWRALADIHLDELFDSLRQILPVTSVNMLLSELRQHIGLSVGFNQIYRFSYTLTQQSERSHHLPVALANDVLLVNDVPCYSSRNTKERVGLASNTKHVAKSVIPQPTADKVAAISNQTGTKRAVSNQAERGPARMKPSVIASHQSPPKLVNLEAGKSVIAEQAIEVLSTEFESLLVKLSQANSHHISAILLSRFYPCLKALMTSDAATLKILLLNYLSSNEVAKLVFKHRPATECHELLILLFSTRYLSLQKIIDLLALVSGSIRAATLDPLPQCLFIIDYLLHHRQVNFSDVVTAYLTMLYDSRASVSVIFSANNRFSSRELFFTQIVRELKAASSTNLAPAQIKQCIKIIEFQNTKKSSVSKPNQRVVTNKNQSKPLSDKTQKQLTLVELERLIYGLSAQNTAEDLETEGDEIHIANAGVVLASPYISRLFSMLAYTESGQFIDEQAQERGAQLLQYMVTGQSEAGEYQLTLNKLLCGIKTAKPLRYSIELSDQEKETADGLLVGIIDNWKTLGQTTPEGLRETFLQRDGVLYREKEAWKLQIQTNAFDMLLDSLPWSFSVIKFPWMERVLHVEWR
ncbi:contractile injection system tape measure protein [Shewanella sp. YLB-07]|uniref:contractile injection system tape measure protein n=1 Tax=Shewanella sp. YLB-07 TaxID=2601268 RepID=UPI00128B4838|nr:contractile injection system tape measure protein [Shewanella sp. YLB-07]MPY23409.1 hypothetical protein [Shewanella sp. YLB-07]